MEVTNELVGSADRSKTVDSEDDDAVQEKEEVSQANGKSAALPDGKPSHVSFLLDEDKDGNRLSDATEMQPLASPSASPSTSTTRGIESQETLKLSEQADSSRLDPLQNFDEEGSSELPVLAQEEQTDNADADADTMVELQQSKSLPEAIELLSKTTQDLEGRVNILLAQHEEDFFAAFRSHMAKVQKHVESLQACADEQKNLLERDLRIKTLQQELQWFVNEAVRLDQVCKRLKRDLLSWRARTDALREDRDFLEAELKKAKRKIRSGQMQGPRTFCISPQECIESQGLAAHARKATAPPATVKKAAPPIQNNPPYQPSLKQLAHTPSDDPQVLKKTIEDLKKQVYTLTAANRRLHNEAKRNSRIEYARDEVIYTELFHNKQSKNYSILMDSHI